LIATLSEQQFLITAAFLKKRGGLISPAGLESERALYFGQETAEEDGALARLIARGLLNEQNGQLALNPAVTPLAEDLLRQNPRHVYFYNEFFTRAASSPTHARFCQQVYGRDLTQHGMADMQQIDWVIATLGLGVGSHVLELGCGNGRIGEYISDVSGAHLTGIDTSRVGIAQAQQRTSAKADRLSFIQADMSALHVLPGAYDTILAIDTLYFVSDQLEDMLHRLNAIAAQGGQIGAFFSLWGHADQRENFNPERTSFFQAVTALDLPCQYWDFSQAEAAHWTRKYAAAAALKADFEREGNAFLYERRYGEAAEHMQHVRDGRVARFFYRVQL
jgi:cyclopropane fatty-acyl-phospholipid synthase-like methyltransferase